jgi:hypothetical protein
MPYKIEKNAYRIGSTKKYPFDDMEVGDSFFVPHPKAKAARQAALGRNSRPTPKHRPFRDHWATREVEGGVRIWRVK